MDLNLYICEKPSLAKNVAAALSSVGGGYRFTGGRDGYYEGKDGIILGSVGHIFELYDIEDYPDMKQYVVNGKARWRLDNLPYIPDPFAYKPAKGFSAKYRQMKEWINSPKVETIYNVGDSDREGEIIVRNILTACGNKKPVLRVWHADETPEELVRAIKEARPDAEYDNLAAAGYTRTFEDWLIGINFSRYIRLMKGELLPHGRVMACMTNAIYERDREIENFVPETYYIAEGNAVIGDGEIKLTAKDKFKSEDEARGRAEYYNSLTAVVSGKKTETKKVPRPKLFSQETLQKAMAKRYGYKPDMTLQYTQSLYETHKLVSYPRTDVEYMTDGEKDKVKGIIRAIQPIAPDVVFMDTKRVFDSSKVQGDHTHSALVPTKAVPKDLSALSKGEQNVYKAILYRFCAAFCKDECLEDVTKLTIDLRDGTDTLMEQFVLTGKALRQKGWKKYEGIGKDKLLPNVEIGDVLPIRFTSVEKQTQPPKHYTTTTFINFLTHPLKKEEIEEEAENSDTDDTEEYKAILAGLTIGETSSRAGIIKKIINKYEYVEIKNKDSYYITEKGKRYIDTLNRLGIRYGVQETAEMNRQLMLVKKGELSKDTVIGEVTDEIRRVFAAKDSVVIERTGRGPYEKKERYQGNYKGSLVSFSREQRGDRLTDEECEVLLRDETITHTFTAKSGRPYEMKATGLTQMTYNDHPYWGPKWEFAKKREEGVPAIWCGHTFTPEEKASLEKGEKVPLTGCVSKKGNQFDCVVSYGKNQRGYKGIIPEFSK